jgi:hypothetical protein
MPQQSPGLLWQVIADRSHGPSQRLTAANAGMNIARRSLFSEQKRSEFLLQVERCLDTLTPNRSFAPFLRGLCSRGDELAIRSQDFSYTIRVKSQWLLAVNA